jgi:hypothetical protein
VNITFKSQHVVFKNGRIFFGGNCCGNCLSATPSCVLIRRTDFIVCGGCATAACVTAWDGKLTLAAGPSWTVALKCAHSNHSLKAAITVAAGVYTLVVQCDTNANVWTGTLTSSHPCGQYIRTSGCDTTQSVFVL